MAKGRPPKPTDVLKLQSTFRNDRHADRVAVNGTLSAEPVKWLTAKEKKVWEKWHHVLQRNGILKETDEVALGMLCKIFVRVQDLSKEFKTPKDMITTHMSDVGALVDKVHPLYPLLVEAEKNLLRLLTEFGMTPVSRSKVKAAIEEEEDPFDKIKNM